MLCKASNAYKVLETIAWTSLSWPAQCQQAALVMDGGI